MEFETWCPSVNDDRRRQLVRAARAAVAQAFLTKEGGTRYGAAVLTVTGSIFNSGQYSSWNHITNIHAEQASLLLATMAGQPDIAALAVASTNDEPVTRPCGVCRQVMLEHATRIGHDFEVLMAYRDGDGFDHSLVSELLPESWSARTQEGAASHLPRGERLRDGILRKGHKPVKFLRVGDHVVLADGSIAMVWDPRFTADHCLLKIKYAPPRDGQRRKVAHSFTEALQYERELHALGWASTTPLGATAAVVGYNEIGERLPALRVDLLDTQPPQQLLDVFRSVGIEHGAVYVTGSRAIGLERAESDWDVVAVATPQQILAFRERLADALQRRQAEIPAASGTWQLLNRLVPGGTSAIVSKRRFLETLSIDGQSVAVIFTAEDPTPVLDESCIATVHRCYFGTVVTADLAPYKRAQFDVDTGSGELLKVVSFHKAGNLVQVGDRLALRGWMIASASNHCLVQLLPSRDNIVWTKS